MAPFVVIIGAYAALGVRLRQLLSAGSKAAVKRPGRAMTRTTLVVTLTTLTTLVVTLAFVITQLPYYVVEILHAAKADHLASLRRTTATATPPADNSTQQPSSVTPTAQTPLTAIADDVTDDVRASTDRHQSCVSSRDAGLHLAQRHLQDARVCVVLHQSHHLRTSQPQLQSVVRYMFLVCCKLYVSFNRSYSRRIESCRH